MGTKITHALVLARNIERALDRLFDANALVDASRAQPGDPRLPTAKREPARAMRELSILIASAERELSGDN
jgi:hypothetical protein